MMTLERFKKVMTDLRIYQEWEDKLANCGIDIWEREEISNIVTNYINMIAADFNLPHNDLYGTELDYYLYEVHGFDNSIEQFEEPWDSLEHLYDYLAHYNDDPINFG